MKTSIKCSSKPSVSLELSWSRERVEVLRRGTDIRRSSPYLYPYESEGVVREKCRGVGSLLPTCTSTDATTFFGFGKYLLFLSLVFYLV